MIKNYSIRKINWKDKTDRRIHANYGFLYGKKYDYIITLYDEEDEEHCQLYLGLILNGDPLNKHSDSYKAFQWVKENYPELLI